MKLYSKFHDYYDTSIAYGIDELCHYTRNKEKFNYRSNEYKQFPTSENIIDKIIKANHAFYFYKILFCGKMYSFSKVVFNNYASVGKSKTWYFYDYESLNDKFGGTFGFGHYYYSNKIKLFFDDVPNNETLLNYHHEIGTPIVYCDDESLIFNPCLKDYEFYKTVDAVTAFQEISMFISGVLGGNSPKMVELEDKDLIKKHGYDKWSFRKLPENT